MDKKYYRFFEEKKQDKTKCRNIIDYDLKSLPISPEKLSDDEKNEQRQNSSSNKCHWPFALLIF